MTWTYNVADLATSEKDQIRLEIADTDINNQLLQDEEIQQAITVESNFWNSAARCAEMIARLFLRKADVRLGRVMMVTYTKMAEQWLDMAKDLRKKGLGTQTPYIGGLYVTDKVTLANDPNIVAPLFTKTMQENPWAAPYTTDSLPPVVGGDQVYLPDVDVG